jgi:hypothetical protein
MKKQKQRAEYWIFPAMICFLVLGASVCIPETSLSLADSEGLGNLASGAGDLLSEFSKSFPSLGSGGWDTDDVESTSFDMREGDQGRKIMPGVEGYGAGIYDLTLQTQMEKVGKRRNFAAQGHWGSPKGCVDCSSERSCA